MTDIRTDEYAKSLSRLIQIETVSTFNQTDKTKFYDFHNALREMFPELFEVCTFENFDGSFLMRWKGKTNKEPVMLMNHHDVVEATGNWTHLPFGGEIAEGKLWGRGTLDTKGGLWAMMQAAEELAKDGFIPERDIYFLSACTEECAGEGADTISRELEKRGLRFHLILDEGGYILEEPIAGAKGKFAVIGLGEKGCADLKFIARSKGGHASIPPKNSPLVRLGKFMAAVEKKNLFETKMAPIIHATFDSLAGSMNGPLKFVLKNSKIFKPLLINVMPMVSGAAGAMLRTTVAFTMASGSEGTNVLPQEAWVIANMRYSHHQGGKSSIEAIRKLAEKFDIETVVLDPGVDSPISSHESDAYKLIDKAVSNVFKDVKTTPYIMTAASDSRFMWRLSENCLRFAPFSITDEQLESVHGIDENVDLSCLAPAVDFYRYIITNA
ncbi:MAG: M20/M25/M40 family metallo-hydrolase [Ruminococcaceae bacterium]|nr:M20/M25/M40 family metallo-hydrolase [Oscillospiraceae bacterium]